MKMHLLSNNPLILGKYPEGEYLEGSFREVLVRSRDYIHQGYELLTHPLAGSIKPNQTPYKSLLLKKNKDRDLVHFSSLQLIESALASLEKFGPAKQHQPGVLDDLQVIDLSLLEAALESLQPGGITAMGKRL